MRSAPYVLSFFLRCPEVFLVFLVFPTFFLRFGRSQVLADLAPSLRPHDTGHEAYMAANQTAFHEEHFAPRVAPKRAIRKILV